MLLFAELRLQCIVFFQQAVEQCGSDGGEDAKGTDGDGGEKQ